jgi:hypothetical protein
MNNITMADILKIRGTWMRAKEFNEFASEKLGISQRQVVRRTKEAIKKGEILRRKIPGTETVVLGLAEFGCSDDCCRELYSDCGLNEAFGNKLRIKF